MIRINEIVCNIRNYHSLKGMLLLCERHFINYKFINNKYNP